MAQILLHSSFPQLPLLSLSPRLNPVSAMKSEPFEKAWLLRCICAYSGHVWSLSHSVFISLSWGNGLHFHLETHSSTIFSWCGSSRDDSTPSSLCHVILAQIIAFLNNWFPKGIWPYQDRGDTFRFLLRYLSENHSSCLLDLKLTPYCHMKLGVLS